MSRTVTIRASYSGRWSKLVDVEIPDEPITPAEWTRLADEATREVDPDPADWECDDWEIVKSRSNPSNPVPYVPGAFDEPVFDLSPPTDYWETWDGSRWCSDGKHMIREGRPYPSEAAMDVEWKDIRGKLADVDKWVESATLTEPPNGFEIPKDDNPRARRTRQVLDGLSVTFSPTFQAVGRDQDGKVQAIAMLWRAD